MASTNKPNARPLYDNVYLWAKCGIYTTGCLGSKSSTFRYNRKGLQHLPLERSNKFTEINNMISCKNNGLCFLIRGKGYLKSC